MRLHYYKTDILNTLSTSLRDVLIYLVADYLIRTIRREDSYRMGMQGEDKGGERKRNRSTKLQMCKDRPKAGGVPKIV